MLDSHVPIFSADVPASSGSQVHYEPGGKGWHPEPRRKGEGMAEAHERKMAEAAAYREAEMRHYTLHAPIAEGWCYFIGFRDEGGGLVKIGHTNNVSRRFGQLRGNSGPYRLRLLATCRGGRSSEMHYHRKFEDYAVGNEWFNLTPEIEAEITRLNDSGSLGVGL